jgi:hypothetical protein
MGLTVENGKVLILDPFDQRCATWDVAADICTTDAAYEFATILCPLDTQSSHPYSDLP